MGSPAHATSVTIVLGLNSEGSPPRTIYDIGADDRKNGRDERQAAGIDEKGIGVLDRSTEEFVNGMQMCDQVSRQE
jgi:hypothetical protein